MVFMHPQYTLSFAFGQADMRELTCSEDEAVAVGRVLLRNGAEVHMKPHHPNQWAADIQLGNPAGKQTGDS